MQRQTRLGSRIVLGQSEVVFVPACVVEVQVHHAERGVHGAADDRRGFEIERQALDDGVHHRGLQCRDLAVHVLVCRRCLQAQAQQMVLIGLIVEGLADQSQVEKRHQNLTVVH